MINTINEFNALRDAINQLNATLKSLRVENMDETFLRKIYELCNATYYNEDGPLGKLQATRDFATRFPILESDVAALKPHYQSDGTQNEWEFACDCYTDDLFQIVRWLEISKSLCLDCMTETYKVENALYNDIARMTSLVSSALLFKLYDAHLG